MTKAKRKRGRKAAPANAKRPGRTAPGPLTPTGGNHREATETAARIERRKLAWDLYVYSRWSMAQIAAHLTAKGLKCSAFTVADDIHKSAAESRTETSMTMRHGIDIELRRLDQLDGALLPLAMGRIEGDRVETVVTQGKGKSKREVRKRIEVPLKAEPRTRIQLEAMEKLRRNSESRRKLLGTDRQPDEGFVAVEQVVAMVRGLVSDVLAITAAHVEMRKQLSEAMRRRFGVIDGEVVEQA